MIVPNYPHEIFVFKPSKIFHMILKVFWGQEHLNCLVLLHELLNGYLNEEGNFEVQVFEAVPQMPSPLEKNQIFKSEQSSDDLRTGLFQYIRDAGK